MKYCTVKEHYDLLIDEGNDPVHDPDVLKAYMDRWDGDTFIKALELAKDKRVLEIGVGTGRLALRTAPFSESFTGIDISEKTIERAKENMRDCRNVKLIPGDFLTHEFSEKYDVIYSSLTFMHIEDKGTALKKAAKLLKKGGRIVISIDKDPSSVIEYGERAVKIFPCDPDDMCTAVKEAGLFDINIFETEFAYIICAKK